RRSGTPWAPPCGTWRCPTPASRSTAPCWTWCAANRDKHPQPSPAIGWSKTDRGGTAMQAIIVEGGRPLVGGVEVHGAKNSVLPILAAAILAPGKSVIHNCPPHSDVAASLDILRH